MGDKKKALDLEEFKFFLTYALKPIKAAVAALTDGVAKAAESATKLATARKINGTEFDGSADITTASWGTARNVNVASSDGTGAGAAMSVNGSGDVTLKLPATIKAALDGNATSATTAQTAVSAQTAGSATRAAQDGNGDNIPSTYVKKNSDASLKSLAAAGQVSAGSCFKIGTVSLTVASGSMNTVNGEQLPDSNTITLESLISFYGAGYTKYTHRLIMYDYGSSTSIYPDFNANMGASSKPWENIFSRTALTVTSDRRLKKDITPLAIEFAEKIVEKLVPVSYRLINGQSGRIHYGMISQQIEEVMQELGIDSLDFAPFIKSPVMEDIYGDAVDENGDAVLDENGKPKQVIVGQRETGEYTYMLRYEELYAILWRAFQGKSERIRELEGTAQKQQEKIGSLEERINKLESLLGQQTAV